MGLGQAELLADLGGAQPAHGKEGCKQAGLELRQTKWSPSPRFFLFPGEVTAPSRASVVDLVWLEARGRRGNNVKGWG